MEMILLHLLHQQLLYIHRLILNKRELQVDVLINFFLNHLHHHLRHQYKMHQ